MARKHSLRSMISADLSKLSLGLVALICLIASINVTAQAYLVNGVSKYAEFNRPVFAVKLELPKVRDNAQQIYNHPTTKKLSFRILAERSPRLWTRMLIQNVSMNNDSEVMTAQTNALTKMADTIKGNLVPGDLVEIETLNRNFTVLSVNRVDIATFETEGFFEFLLSGFIGETPPTIEVKKQLLANGEYDPNMLALFDSVSYSQNRIADVKAWAADVNIERPLVDNQLLDNQGQGPANQARGMGWPGQQARGPGGQQARRAGGQQARAPRGQQARGTGAGQRAAQNTLGVQAEDAADLLINLD